VTEEDSNAARLADKSPPKKPYPAFPLFPHANGWWCKKVRGKLHYFGKWADPDTALRKYLEQRDALHAGKKPRDPADEFTVKNLCNEFLNAKQALVDSGELTNRSWQDYKAACDLIVGQFGKGRVVSDLDPDDFAAFRRSMAKGWGPVTLGNAIQRVRVVFRFAYENGLIDREVQYGAAFKRPARKVVRLDRAKKGPKLFTADEVRRLLAAAAPQMKAMILLGINGGLGNADVGRLPLTAVDLDRGVIDFPRPKTGIPRRFALWAETVEAIRAALAARPTPKDGADSSLVFVTKYGRPWAKDDTDQTLAKEFGKLMKVAKVGGRTGLGFYTLRHSFRTVADEARDQPAVDFVMGHENGHMSSVYRQTISDDRLRAVADHVRGWLYSESFSSAQAGLARQVDPSPITAAG
jgi:integrase